MSDPLPPSPASPPGDAAPGSSRTFGVSFLATFAGCVLPATLAGFANGAVGGFLPFIWIGLLLLGIRYAIVGQRGLGAGMVLGSLVGAIVGFSVCAGMMAPLDLR